MGLEDSKIVELYFKRDESAVSETASKYGDYLFKIAYNVLGNKEDSEECVSSAYNGAWNAIPPHRPDILGPFLGKIVRRASIDCLRKKSSLKRMYSEACLSIDELEECIPAKMSVEREVENIEISKAISAYLLSLKLSERHIFVCRYWYSYSIKEISSLFKISESKVKHILHSLRKGLKSYFEKEEIIL